jgi:hypothetical protein
LEEAVDVDVDEDHLKPYMEMAQMMFEYVFNDLKNLLPIYVRLHVSF